MSRWQLLLWAKSIVPRWTVVRLDTSQLVDPNSRAYKRNTNTCQTSRKRECIFIYIYYIVSYIFIDIKYIGSLDSTLDMLPNMCWIVLLFFGCQVAVKVQRPDVREQVTLDLFVVRQIASIGRVWWGDILRHSSAWYSCELCCCLVWFCLAFLWRIEISFSLFFKSWNSLSASPSVDFLTANLKFLSCRGPEQILCIPWRFICANWKVCLSAVD